MTVHFKFRSSPAFETADLGGRPSISVRDLRALIVARKNLQTCRDFELLISDAVTGYPFDDEELQIPDGSSVVIKRVPAAQSLPPPPPDLLGSRNAGSSVAAPARNTGFVTMLPTSPSELGSRNAGSSIAAPTRNTGFVIMLPTSPSEDIDIENFDDFGIDLHPTLEASLSESDAEVSSVKTVIHKKDGVVPRCQILERNYLSEAMSKGIIEKCKKESDSEENNMQTKLNLIEEHRMLDECVGMSTPAMLNTDLPAELRCCLCNTIFKEAVLIPCCQHSFCDKCIRSALVERARCPKCSSLKCKVEDLLPNLSLRQAIEHFLDAQVAVNGMDNIITDNVPDGESGIQAKEASCAVSIRQQDLAFPHSPSATGKGSNQVAAESAYENKRIAGIGSRLLRLNASKSTKPFLSSSKVKQLKGNENSTAEARKQIAGFEAGGSSKLSQNVLRKEEDDSGVSLPPFKHRKGDRTCYMCGSPNHLIRDCPAARNPYPVLQPGDASFPGGMPAYGQAYWHGAAVPHIRPYPNIFGASGMMPYDPTMVPVSPFGVPSYMPSLYAHAGMSVPYGFMSMGGVAPSFAGTEHPFTRTEFMDLQDVDRNHKPLVEYPYREVDYDNISEYYHNNGARRKSREQRHYIDKESTRSCPDRDSQTTHKKNLQDRHYSPHRRPDFTSDEDIYSIDVKPEKRPQVTVSGRDDRPFYSEKSNSEVQDLSNNSQQWSRERKRHHHESLSKKHSDKRVVCGSESSRKSHHRSQQEKSVDTEKIMKDKKRQSHKHHYSSESGCEPDYSSYRRKRHKDKESSQSSRHSRQKVTSIDDQLEDDRWEMADGLGEDYRGDCYYRKRKRSN